MYYDVFSISPSPLDVDTEHQYIMDRALRSYQEHRAREVPVSETKHVVHEYTESLPLPQPVVQPQRLQRSQSARTTRPGPHRTSRASLHVTSPSLSTQYAPNHRPTYPHSPEALVTAAPTSTCPPHESHITPTSTPTSPPHGAHITPTPTSPPHGAHLQGTVPPRATQIHAASQFSGSQLNSTFPPQGQQFNIKPSSPQVPHLHTNNIDINVHPNQIIQCTGRPSTAQVRLGIKHYRHSSHSSQGSTTGSSSTIRSSPPKASHLRTSPLGESSQGILRGPVRIPSTEPRPVREASQPDVREIDK